MTAFKEAEQQLALQSLRSMGYIRCSAVPVLLICGSFRKALTIIAVLACRRTTFNSHQPAPILVFSHLCICSPQRQTAMSFANYRSGSAIYQAGKMLAAELETLMRAGMHGPEDILNILFRYKNYERFRDVQPVVKKLSHVKMDTYSEAVWRSAIKSCPSFDLQRWGEFAELIDLAHAAWLDKGAGFTLHQFIVAHPSLLEKLGLHLRRSPSSRARTSTGLPALATMDTRQVAIIPKGKLLAISLPALPAKRPAVGPQGIVKSRAAASTGSMGALTPSASSQGLASMFKTSSPRRSNGSPGSQQKDKLLPAPVPRRADSVLSKASVSTSYPSGATSTVSTRSATPASTSSSRSVSPAKGVLRAASPLRFPSSNVPAGTTLRDRFQEGQNDPAGVTSARAPAQVPSSVLPDLGRGSLEAGLRPKSKRRPPQLRHTKRMTYQRIAVAV